MARGTMAVMECMETSSEDVMFGEPTRVTEAHNVRHLVAVQTKATADWLLTGIMFTIPGAILEISDRIRTNGNLTS